MSPTFLALYAAVRGTIIIGLLLLAGTQSAAILVGRSLRPATAERIAAVRARLDALPARLVLLLLAAMVARAALQVWSFRDPDEGVTAPLARGVLFDTPWGHNALLELGVGVLLLVALRFTPWRHRALQWLITALVAVMLWAQSGMGHAASDHWSALVGRLVDTTHLIGGGLWLGTLGVIGLTAARVLTERSDLPAMATLIRAFSVYARVGAALVIASGIIAAVVYAGSLRLFLASTWGRLLLGKVAALGGVAALGWYNWRVATPALVTGEITVPALKRSIAIELGFGVIILGITAVLVASALPGES